MSSQQTTRRLSRAQVAANKTVTKTVTGAQAAFTSTTVNVLAVGGGVAALAPVSVAVITPAASTPSTLAPTAPGETSANNTAVSHNSIGETGSSSSSSSSSSTKADSKGQTTEENIGSSSSSNNAASNHNEVFSENSATAEELNNTATAQDTDVAVAVAVHENIAVSPSLTAVASPAFSISSTTTTVVASPIVVTNNDLLNTPEFTLPKAIPDSQHLDASALVFLPSSTPKAEAQEANPFKLNAAALSFSPFGFDATAKSFIPSAPIHYICNKTTLSRIDSSSPPLAPAATCSSPSTSTSSSSSSAPSPPLSSYIALFSGTSVDHQVTNHGDHTPATSTADDAYMSSSSSSSSWSPTSTFSQPLDPKAVHFMPPNYSDYWDEIYKRKEYDERLLNESSSSSSSKTGDQGEQSDESDDEQQQSVHSSGAASAYIMGQEWDRLQKQQEQEQQLEQEQQSQQQQARSGHWNEKTERMAQDECFRIHLGFELDNIAIAKRVNGIQDKQAEREHRDNLRRIFDQELHRCLTWRLNACRDVDDETCDMICGSELPELASQQPPLVDLDNNGLVARVIGPDEDYEDIMEEMYTANRPKYRWRPPHVPRCERIQRGVDESLQGAMSAIGPTVAWWASVNKEWFDRQTTAVRAHIVNQDAMERPLNGNGTTLVMHQAAWKRLY